jgi:hypothetical protein
MMPESTSKAMRAAKQRFYPEWSLGRGTLFA